MNFRTQREGVVSMPTIRCLINLQRVLILIVLLSATTRYLTVSARAGQSEQSVGMRTASTLSLPPVDGNTRCSYRWPPRVIYNTDGNGVFNYLPNRCPEKLTGIMEALKDTSVDVISVLER